LAPLLNYARTEEERFPLRLAQSLSRALSGAGLRFHKSGNRTTFVSASRPRYLNLEELAVSDSIRKIIEAIRAKKSLRRSQLLDLLAPAAAPSAEPVVPAEPAPVSDSATAEAGATAPSPAPARPSPVADPRGLRGGIRRQPSRGRPAAEKSAEACGHGRKCTGPRARGGTRP
jgi:hypothetical protein